MTRRPYHRPPEGRHRDRHDRRAVLDVLLGRAQRGVLTPAEGALLAEHVREEQRVADENRRAMAGTTQALERHREAADAAIREAEAERDRLARVVQDMHDGINRTAHEAFAERKRHREAEQALRDQYEQQLADARAAVDRVRTLAADARARGLLIHPAAVEAALDVDQAHAADAAIRAHFLAAADSTEARLAEQQREHDVALATSRRNAVEAAREAREQRHRAERYRLAWLAARRDRKADRAAMRADLATIQAAEQRLAAVEQALATAREERDRALDLAAARGDALAAHLAHTEPTR